MHYVSKSDFAQKYAAATVNYLTKEAFGEIRDAGTQEETVDLAERAAAHWEKCGIFRYVPHPKQEWFHRANCQTKSFTGSNQSGKTTAAVVELLSWLTGQRLYSGEQMTHPFTGAPVKAPVRVMFGADDFANKVMEVIMPKMDEMLPLAPITKKVTKGQGGAVNKIELENGSSVKFLSYDQPPAKWEGYTWNAAFFDEPPPRYAYIGTKRGCMRHAAPVYFSFTPLSEPWIYEEILSSPKTVNVEEEKDLDRIKPKSIFSVNVTIYDNPYLEADQIEEFANTLDDDEKEARLKGKPAHLQGRVYKKFNDDLIVSRDWFEERYGEIQKDGEPLWKSFPWGRIVDPHDRRPFAYANFVVTPRQDLIFVGEWPDYDFYATKSSDMSVAQYANAFREAESDFLHEATWSLMDPRFARAPKATTNTTLVDEFADLGSKPEDEGAEPMFFELMDVTDNVEVGHLKCRTMIREKKVFWLDHLHNFCRGMNNYTYQDWSRDSGSRAPKNSVSEKWKDFPDCFRYVVERGVEYFEPPARRRKEVFNSGFGRSRRAS